METIEPFSPTLPVADCLWPCLPNHSLAIGSKLSLFGAKISCMKPLWPGCILEEIILHGRTLIWIGSSSYLWIYDHSLPLLWAQLVGITNPQFGVDYIYILVDICMFVNLF